ncbi:MAG: hypothetical protein NW201_06365, partial [Gemmatimonadales bacterium]|nr:hypothetical protein [Gemmatimonadales bacterium]
PTTYIGSRKVEGARPFEQVRPLVEAELRGQTKPHVPALAWFGLPALFLCFGLVVFRTRASAT